jgi:hypothetical protein
MLLTGSTVIERNASQFSAQYRLVDRGPAGWEGALTLVASIVDELLPFGVGERLTFPLDADRRFRFVVQKVLFPYTLHVRGVIEPADDVLVVALVPAKDRRRRAETGDAHEMCGSDYLISAPVALI